MKWAIALLVLLVLFVLRASCEEKPAGEDPLDEPKAEEKSEESSPTGEPTPASNAEDEQNKAEESQYKLGSLCNYCSYCKFCKLCDKDCPCKTSKKKPNCHLCKYCKYCSLCSICDVACTPGGIVDVVSSAIYSSLPTFTKKDQEEVDKDIEKARDFIKEYL